MIVYQLNFSLKFKSNMLIQIVAYSLIAFQLDLVLCRPQSQNFNGSNPYYDSYLNQYFGDNSFSYNNPNPYSTTQKSLYPTLFPQVPTTTPQPYFAKGQHYPSAPQSNYFNRNSTFQYPINNFGSNDSAYGWNSNFNPHTTSPSYQPYGQYIPTTVKPPVTTLPPYNPYNPTGSFNQYNRTGSAYPSNNRTSSPYPAYNRTNPTYPSYRPQPTLPSNRTQGTYPSYRPQPTYPSYRPQPSIPNTHPPTFNYNHNQSNFTNNNYNSSSVNKNWNRNNTLPPHQYPFSSQNNGQGTKNNNNFINNYNFNRSDNNYNPQYRPSAPTFMTQGNGFASNPQFDQNGVPLASFESYHANQPINDNLFNYDNLHRRRPNNGFESSSYEQSNVPLAPFPGNNNAPTYDAISNVPLAPFPGRRF